MIHNPGGKMIKTCLVCSALVVMAARAAPISLNIESITEKSDGMETSYAVLQGAGFEGRYYADGNWTLAENPAQGASLTFTHRLVEGMFMDLGVYPGFSLLEDYSEESIRAYAAGIKKKYLSIGLDAVKLKAQKSPLGGASFMGRAYWRVSFDVLNPQTKKVRMSVCDFVSIGGRSQNFRLRFYGEPKALSMLSPQFEPMLRAFQVE